MKASELAALIEPNHRKRVCIGDRKQWYFTKNTHLPVAVSSSGRQHTVIA